MFIRGQTEGGGGVIWLCAQKCFVYTYSDDLLDLAVIKRDARLPRMPVTKKTNCCHHSKMLFGKEQNRTDTKFIPVMSFEKCKILIK